MVKQNFGEYVGKIVDAWNQHKPRDWITHPPIDWAKPPTRLLGEVRKFSGKIGEQDWAELVATFTNGLRAWVANAKFNDLSYEWTLTQVLNSDKLYHYCIKSRQSPTSAEVLCRWQPGLRFSFLGHEGKVVKLDGIIVWCEMDDTMVDHTIQYLDKSFEDGWISIEGDEL
jgi:hypothetical protein